MACGTTLFKWKGCVAGQYLSAVNTQIKGAVVDFILDKGDNTPIAVENAADNGTEKCEFKIENNDESPVLAVLSGTFTIQELIKGLGATKTEFEVMTK
jgi:hypothetical protein